MYDVFFLSYDEPNADENWLRLKSFAPMATRIHGVPGILYAHKAAAEKSKTDAFFVVDGDAWLMPSWSFSGEEFDELEPYDGKTPADCVIVWKSLNPYNGLEYGYGGVKLMSKKAVLAADTNVDVATSVSECFMSVDTVACETRFGSTAWHAWRGAYRECAKLASSTVGTMNEEQKSWLKIWTTVASGPFKDSILAGANAGKDYGLAHKGNKEAISMINDYNWLRDRYDDAFRT